MAGQVKSKRRDERVLYLYGVTRAGRRAPAAASLVGVDGSAPVEALACDGLLCWVSRVDREQFAERLGERMQDLDWVAGAGVRHQRVVAAIGRGSAVLPARFGTIFHVEGTLLRDMRRRRRILQAAFRRVADADEWGVKVFVIRAAAPAVKAASGKSFLKAKAALLRDRPAPAADPEVQRFAREAKKLARAATPGGKISQGQRGLEWQASLLVPRSRRRQLLRLVQQYTRRWQDRRRIECTGPWPPYSFVSDYARKT